MTKKNKDYITLANERAERQASHQQERDKLERDKFEHNKRKDIKNGIISVIVGIPIIIIIITFTIVWLRMLSK